MLKHVSMGTLPFRGNTNRSMTMSSDTISINSSISFASNNSNGSSNGSSAPGTPDSAEISSRSSSSTSIQDIGVQKFVVKIFARVLCPDVEYKTLLVTAQTNAKEVIRMLLNKFRMKHRDQNLFYLTMEVWIRKTGIPIRSVMVLDNESCPAQLQACYPHHNIKFTLMMKRGGLVKVYDTCLMSGSLYKSLLISDNTTVEELIQLLLYCCHSKERHSKFALYEVCPPRKCERKLHKDELPLRIQYEWPTQDLYFFQLRYNNDEPSQRRRIPWMKSLDSLGNVTFRLSLKDEANTSITTTTMATNATAAAINHSLKSTFNDYENFFYI